MMLIWTISGFNSLASMGIRTISTSKCLYPEGCLYLSLMICMNTATTTQMLALEFSPGSERTEAAECVTLSRW
jgi:hypothetical protein